MAFNTLHACSSILSKCTSRLLIQLRYCTLLILLFSIKCYSLFLWKGALHILIFTHRSWPYEVGLFEFYCILFCLTSSTVKLGVKNEHFFNFHNMTWLENLFFFEDKSTLTWWYISSLIYKNVYTYKWVKKLVIRRGACSLSSGWVFPKTPTGATSMS